MTDAELIELVQTKLPHDLTGVELSELAERLPNSPALQEALAEHLEMERYLADTLGRVSITPESILARARSTPAVRLRQGARRWVALTMLLGLALVVVAVIWRFPGNEEKPDPDQGGIAAVTVPPTHDQKPATGAAPRTIRQPDDPSKKTSPPDDSTPVTTVEAPRMTAPDPYTMVDLSEPGLNEAQLKAWFAPIEGQPHTTKLVLPPPGRTDLAAMTEMTGLWRLRPTWKADASLRCLFRTLNTFKFHIWNGTDGVTLELFRGTARYPSLPDQSLVAYRTTRKGKEPRPESLVLAATDEGEYWRTRTQFNPAGYPRLISTPIDLRHENGLLTVSFGDVRLMSVPFTQTPAEVYFEGEVSFQAIGLAPLIALTPMPEPRPVALDVEKPAELKWLGDQAQLANHPGGSVELAAGKAPARVAVATMLPPQGVCETILQLEGVTPGTGVFLGDEKGQPRYVVSFLRDETTGRTLALETSPGEIIATTRFTPPRWPPAFVSDRVWLRLLLAGDQLKCWVSTDGVHWGRAFESPIGRAPVTWSSLGLFCNSGDPRRSLRLRRLTLRELRTLNSLAPADLVRRVPLTPPNQYIALGDWLAAVHGSRPADVDPAAWSRACAIRALASGISPSLGMALLDRLLDHGLAQPMPVEAKLRLLDEALLLVPRSSIPINQRFAGYYARLGQVLVHEGEARPYSRLRQATYHNPVWAGHVLDVFPESLAVTEMLELAGAGKWDEAERLARFGRLHRFTPSVFDWAESLATGRRQRKKLAAKRGLMPRGWEPGLVLEQDRDGTTDLGEIEAALRADSIREAARILTRLDPRGGRALLPDSQDSQRLTSWPVALAGMIDAHPGLRTFVRTELAPEAKLALRRALDEKDENALETLALRYPGSEEAAEALLWLGDRHLGDGEPAVAVGRYRQALRMAEGALRRRLDDRLQLAAALLGQPLAAPPEAEIEFGTTRLSPAALRDLNQKRRETGVDSRWSAALPPQVAPAPDTLDAVRRGRFEGETGDKPNAVPILAEGRPRLDIDWFARHVGLAATGDRLFVSNRFQVDCYEMPSGKLLWRAPLSRDPARQELPAPAFEFPLTPMRPVIAGPHLFVRRLLRGPAFPPRWKGDPQRWPTVTTLVCLDTANGKVLWTTSNHVKGGLQYVSDPVVIQDQVFAVGQRESGEGERMLTLVAHNRADGTVLAERPMTALHDTFDEQRGCQVAALEDTCVATIGGGILCFDLAGNVRWARRSLWVPPPADPHWLVQEQQPPLVSGNRCFVVQPGVLNLVCIAPESGRLHWQKAIVGLRRLAGLVGDRLLVQTDRGFLCLDAATGKEQWHHDAGSVPSSVLCGGAGGLLYDTIEAIPGEKDLHRPRLVWVDLETGRERTHLALDALRHAHPHFGPLFVAGDRLWVFSGKGPEVGRDLLELVPKGQQLPATRPQTDWDAWLSNVPAPVCSAADKVLPGWTVFQGKSHPKMGLVSEVRGQRDVLCAAAPFTAGRRLDVPDTAKPRLLLRVINEPRGPCLIAVEVDGKRLLAQEISAATAHNQWKDWEVDLSEFKGRSAWVVVQHLPRNGDTACSHWAKIELVK